MGNILKKQNSEGQGVKKSSTDRRYEFRPITKSEREQWRVSSYEYII